MGSLKDIRVRISSVKSTRKITSAMKVVSAAKFHKAQEQQQYFQHYMERFQHTMALAMRHSAGYSHPLMEVAMPEAPVALLLFSSNSSLCGAYNTSVISCALARIRELHEGGREVVLFAFGKRAIEGLQRAGYTLEIADTELVNAPTFEEVINLFDTFSADFLTGCYSAVEVVYNHFHNAASQTPRVVSLLPIAPQLAVEASSRVEYIFEPTVRIFFDHTLPHYARLMLHTFVLSNYVGEHGARMTAMTQATDNANNLVDELTLEYNKARQAAITNEILEIVSGANALAGDC